MNNETKIELKQVYRKTSETLKAEMEIRRYIKASPQPLEKRIGTKLFNILLKETPKEFHVTYITNGIPYKHETDEGFVRYTLRAA
jgi:hypothetical protein